MRDDNLFRLPDAETPRSVGLSTDHRDDQMLAPFASVAGKVQGGRQELDYLGSVTRQDLVFNRGFDETFRNYSLDWKWQLTNDWDGDASNSLQESLTSFSSYFSTVPNRQSTHTDHFLAQWHPRPDRRIGVRYDEIRGLNSLSSRNYFDFRSSTGRAEIAFDSALGHEIVLGVSENRTEYPNRTIVSFAPIDNSFRQHQVDVSTRYAFSGKSSIDILYGYAKRYYADVPNRNFSGPVGSASLTYQAGARLALTAGISRDLNGIDDLFRIYTISTSARAGFGYAVSTKVQFEAGENASRSDYKGDPSNLYTLFFGPAPARIDRERDIYSRLIWSPRDRWNIQLQQMLSHRTSTTTGFDFRDRTVQIQLSYRVGAL